MMIYPLPDLLDKISIVKIKTERTDEPECKKEIAYLMDNLPDYGFAEANTYITRLHEINGKIWDLEADIRKGKDGELGLEEIGRRTIKIRGLNKIRISIKNEIVEKTNTGFKDIKINHAST
jgi:hypothetical protein